MAWSITIFVAISCIFALSSAKPQFPIGIMGFQSQYPMVKMRFGEPRFGEKRFGEQRFGEPSENFGDEFPAPAIGFSLGGMDDRLKAAPAGLDRSFDEGMGSMFGGESPFGDSDVKTTIKNETKGNMKITTVDKKGKNFHMVSQVSELKDNSSGGFMSGRKEMTSTIAGGSMGPGAMGADVLGGGMGGGLGALGSIFGSVLGGMLGGEAGEGSQKAKDKKVECSGKKPCPAGKFCDPMSSKCRKQLEEGSSCVMKGQCKGKDVVCKWGKCNKAQPGDAGTFCQKNKDCKGDAGCNMRQEISRFQPICSPRLDVGSVCGRTNPMASLFEGKPPSDDDDEENQDPDSNPCKKGLKCASVGMFGTKICVSMDVKLRTDKEEKARIESKEKEAEAEESGSGDSSREEKEETDGPAPMPKPPKDGPTLPGETDPEEPANKPANKTKGKKEKEIAKGNGKNIKKDDKKKKEKKTN